MTVQGATTFRDNIAATGSRLTNCFKQADFVSKIFKLAQEILAMIGELAISERTRENALSVRSGLKDATTIMGLPKVFQGIIQGAYHDAIGASNAVSEIIDDRADTRSWLSLGEHSMGFIGKVTAAFAFAVVRWITFLEKHLGEFGKNAHSIGQTFPTLMLITHSTGVVSGACAIANQNMDASAWGEEQVGRFSATIAGFFEDSIDLSFDVMQMMSYVAHPLIRIPLSLAAAMVGVYKVWVKTT